VPLHAPAPAAWAGRPAEAPAPVDARAAASDASAFRAEERADAIVRRLLLADDVPAFSRVMRELMASLGRDESSMPQLASLVLRDYALTTRVIRTANSAHYNRAGRPVQSATHAIMLLGARTVRELASGVLLFEQYRNRSPGLKELMLLSLLTASHARGAAEAVGGADPESAHLCGMFRNLGEVLVAAHLPVEYAEVLRRQAARPGGVRPGRSVAAREVMGCAFEDVGAAVARHWGMPDSVRLGMHATGAAGETRLVALAGFAHALTGAIYREEAGRSAAATAELLGGPGARLGVTRELCKRLADRGVRDTRDVFAAAGLRLDDLRLTRQVTEALAEPASAGRALRLDRTPAAPSAPERPADPAPTPAPTRAPTRRQPRPPAPTPPGRRRPRRPPRRPAPRRRRCRPRRPAGRRRSRPPPWPRCAGASRPSSRRPRPTSSATICRASCSWRSRRSCGVGRSTAPASTRPMACPAPSARAPVSATASTGCSRRRASRSPARPARPAPRCSAARRRCSPTAPA
jgi:HD-like signal output (HDOD) protein